MIFRFATAADRPAIVALLEQATLLTDDLPDDLSRFMLVTDDNTLAGVTGFEIYGQVALLRSVAVSPVYRQQQLGRQLVEYSQKMATNQGVKILYLITTTAHAYFERLGFNRVDRISVPGAIAQTRQFSNLCPASAVIMSKEI